MEGHCSTGQSPQWAVVPMEEEVVYIITDGFKELMLEVVGPTGLTGS